MSQINAKTPRTFCFSECLLSCLIKSQLHLVYLFYNQKCLKSDCAHKGTLLFQTGHRLYSPWNTPGQNTGVGSCSLLQGIFPTQGSNSGLPHCRWILYQLSHKGSPKHSIDLSQFEKSESRIAECCGNPQIWRRTLRGQYLELASEMAFTPFS